MDSLAMASRLLALSGRIHFDESVGAIWSQLFQVALGRRARLANATNACVGASFGIPYGYFAIEESANACHVRNGWLVSSLLDWTAVHMCTEAEATAPAAARRGENTYLSPCMELSDAISSSTSRIELQLPIRAMVEARVDLHLTLENGTHRILERIGYDRQETIDLHAIRMLCKCIARRLDAAAAETLIFGI